MKRTFDSSNTNALFEALATVRAAKLAGFTHVTCHFFGRGVFVVEAQ